MNMKKTTIILFLGVCALGVSAKSFKRGVSENQFSLEAQMSPLEPGVSWYYNWGNAPGNGYQGQVAGFGGYEYIPMCWNASYNADNIRNYVAGHPECGYLLGFNEPNFTKQANMTPQAAAEKWPEVQALAKELNLKLVAPAMNYSPNAPYQDPLKWMDEFVAIVGKDAFDYTAIHNYGGLGVMKTLANAFHDRYGKEVWVTEFCYWPNEGDANSSVAPSVQIASMTESVEWLEKTEWIYRYAWFKPVGKHETSPQSPSPSFGLIITENGTGPRTLSPQGMVYVHMSDFDKNVWHATETEIPATEYISSSRIALAPGANTEAAKPIEVSQFNNGAWMEYQFDVPQKGVYTLTLTVSGQGEPVRFDPTIKIQSVNGEAVTDLTEPQKFTLPGADATYVKRHFGMQLEAGKQTLRVCDDGLGSPSGIRISTVKLSAGEPPQGSGVPSMGAEGSEDVWYSLDGRRISGEPEAGIYVHNGRKTVVK